MSVPSVTQTAKGTQFLKSEERESSRARKVNEAVQPIFQQALESSQFFDRLKEEIVLKLVPKESAGVNFQNLKNGFRQNIEDTLLSQSHLMMDHYFLRSIHQATEKDDKMALGDGSYHSKRVGLRREMEKAIETLEKLLSEKLNLNLDRLKKIMKKDFVHINILSTCNHERSLEENIHFENDRIQKIKEQLISEENR